MKVAVPTHLTADWIGRELSRRMTARARGGATVKTTYIHPKTISIRQAIALAEQLKK